MVSKDPIPGQHPPKSACPLHHFLTSNFFQNELKVFGRRCTDMLNKLSHRQFRTRWHLLVTMRNYNCILKINALTFLLFIILIIAHILDVCRYFDHYLLPIPRMCFSQSKWERLSSSYCATSWTSLTSFDHSCLVTVYKTAWLTHSVIVLYESGANQWWKYSDF